MGTRFWHCATALARWTSLHTDPEPAYGAETDSAWKSQCCVDFYFYFLQQCHRAYVKYSDSFNIVCILFLKVKSIGHRREGMVCF